jgi:hypothetical protein
MRRQTEPVTTLLNVIIAPIEVLEDDKTLDSIRFLRFLPQKSSKNLVLEKVNYARTLVAGLWQLDKTDHIDVNWRSTSRAPFHIFQKTPENPLETLKTKTSECGTVR